MDRKPPSLRCDPEQHSTLLWPPAVCNHSCIRQELNNYSCCCCCCGLRQHAILGAHTLLLLPLLLLLLVLQLLLLLITWQLLPYSGVVTSDRRPQ